MRWLLLIALLIAPQVVFPQPKEKVIVLSWGDMIGSDQYRALDTVEGVAEAVRAWKAAGISKVLFRVDDFRLLLTHEIYVSKDYQLWYDTTRKAWDAGILKNAVDSVKRAGMEVQMWISLFDEGCPPKVLYSDRVPFPWQSRFSRDNPQYLSHDRSIDPNGRKYHYGHLEFAYPEVRRYTLDVIRKFSDTFPFDGVFLSVRSHSPPPDHADQFGFNEPIVREFERRYGKNILRQSFDLEAWRSLRGEYFTTLLREVRAHLASRGQKLSIGVAQGEHIGPPIGNMRIDWQRWVSERIVDELVVGHHTLERATYPLRWQRGYGYVQNQDERVGLPPIEQSVREAYGPLCRKHNVKLYVDVPLGNFHRVYDDITLGTGKEPADRTEALIKLLEGLPDLTGIVIDGRPFVRLPKN